MIVWVFSGFQNRQMRIARSSYNEQKREKIGYGKL